MILCWFCVVPESKWTVVSSVTYWPGLRSTIIGQENTEKIKMFTSPEIIFI